MSRNLSRTDLSTRLLSVWTVLVLVFLFLPIVAIFIASFNNGRLLIAWEDFGFNAYSEAFAKPAITKSVLVSLQSGFIATIVSTVIGTLAGIALGRAKIRWMLAVTLLLVLVTVTPEIVDAVALLPWMVTLGQDFGLMPFNNGIVRLVIGHSLFATAVVSFIVRARFEGLDSSLEEASADCYATPWQTFRNVTLPLASPAILAGALMSFTLSLDNTVISAFVQVSGSTPWPVYILSSIRTGLRPEIAAVSSLMLLFTLVMLGLVGWILKRSGESTADIARTMGAS